MINKGGEQREDERLDTGQKGADDTAMTCCCPIGPSETHQVTSDDPSPVNHPEEKESIVCV